MKPADFLRVAKSLKMSDAQRFAQHVVPEVVRPARVIWNQAIGGIFLLFAILFFGYALDYFRHLQADSKNQIAFGFSLFLGLVMAFFSLSSFLKARKISRAASSPRS